MRWKSENKSDVRQENWTRNSLQRTNQQAQGNQQLTRNTLERAKKWNQSQNSRRMQKIIIDYPRSSGISQKIIINVSTLRLIFRNV
jgi:hypothetical protein